MLRSIILVAAVGSQASSVGDAFSLANQLPNNIYAIISTGLLSAVIVPQIINAARAPHSETRFISALFTAGGVVFLAAAAVATLCAPLLIDLYAPAFPPSQRALAIAFAYWCLPQLFFYALYALLAEMLNAKGFYGPAAWSPVVNNIVSIAGFGAVILFFGEDRHETHQWEPDSIALLGGAATFGIIVQAVLLLALWVKAGYGLRISFRWRGLGLGSVAHLAKWTLFMVASVQIAALVQSRVVTEASGDASSTSVMLNAWLILMLPYSVIILAIGTPLFTRMSADVAAGQNEAVRTSISSSMRILLLPAVGAAIAVACAAVPATRIFVNSPDASTAAAPVLLGYLVGLIPLAVLFVVQRAFYAYGDTRTPFWFTLFQSALVAATALIAGVIAPTEHLAAVVALGQSLASAAQTILAAFLLRSKLGPIGIRALVLAALRFALAAVPAALMGWLVYSACGGDAGWMVSGSGWLGKLSAVVGAALVAGASAAVYIACLFAMRAPEIRDLISPRA